MSQSIQAMTWKIVTWKIGRVSDLGRSSRSMCEQIDMRGSKAELILRVGSGWTCDVNLAFPSSLNTTYCTCHGYVADAEQKSDNGDLQILSLIHI